MMDLIYMCSKYYLWTALIVLARKSNFVFAPQLQVKQRRWILPLLHIYIDSKYETKEMFLSLWWPLHKK